MRLPFQIVYPLFFLSGTAGLIYEVIWTRLLVLIFGSTTNSIAAVISAFLGGLAIGSFIAGKYVDKLSQKRLIKTYALLEIGIGATAIATLFLLPLIKTLYATFSDGSSVTLNLLAVKFALTIAVLIVPTILMGATLPTLIKFVEGQNRSIGKSVSFLYAINTLGGVLGVIISAFVLIELLGLKNTLLTAAFVNVAIGIAAALVYTQSTKTKNQPTQNSLPLSKIVNRETLLFILAFAISGLISIAYEVLWTRILTPTIGTFIYAFATVLAIYILGLGLGSFLFRPFSKVFKSGALTFSVCQAGIGFFALLSVIITHKFPIKTPLEIGLMILPATLFMGLTFPVIVSQIAREKSLGKIIGLSYFANTIGAIIGGFTASLLIPLLGSSQAIAVLALVNFTIALIFITYTKNNSLQKLVTLTVVAILIIGNFYLVIYKSHRLYQITNDFHILEAKARGFSYSFKEDEVASVFGFYNAKQDDLGLFIDGVATTSRVAETRLMAHIPATLHPNPKRVLVIAFGMGTTYRSSLKRGLETDAIELVPSVPSFMHFFHFDAQEVLANPQGRVIINDGRNYAFLTRKKYDIVTIDPPPPFNAAGTSVLHSREFYEDLAKHLNPDGIVSQWIYYYSSHQDEIAMAIKSFIDVFPHVLAIEKTGSVGGIFLEGSFTPFVPERLANIATDKITISDLAEITGTEQIIETIGNHESLTKLFGQSPEITDDRPRNEYFILRHKFTTSPVLIGDNALKFAQELKNTYNSPSKFTIPAK